MLLWGVSVVVFFEQPNLIFLILKSPFDISFPLVFPLIYVFFYLFSIIFYRYNLEGRSIMSNDDIMTVKELAQKKQQQKYRADVHKSLLGYITKFNTGFFCFLK